MLNNPRNNNELYWYSVQSVDACRTALSEGCRTALVSRQRPSQPDQCGLKPVKCRRTDVCVL